MPKAYGVGTTKKVYGNKLVVSYWNTDVVTIQDGYVTLNSGGWLTQTTKKRMNQVSDEYDIGYKVYQKNGEWFVSFNGKELPFADGMVLNVY